MKKATILGLLVLSAIFQMQAHDPDYFNCFCMIAGKDATTDGSVLVAHNEDDKGEQMINIYTVPRNEAKGTNKYLWIEFPGMKVADGFLNEYGVAVVSDACRSREDRKDLTDGGVVYEVRTLVAQQARSARHGVELIGKLIEQRGYRDSGRSYMVADSKEAWVCSVVRGRHWVAQRVPDNQVMVIPNNYCIGEIDLADTANFKGSADIIEYAQERGWYNPETDGAFSFKKAYSAPKTYHSDRNYIRHMSALNHLTGKTYTTDPDTYPFSVVPAHKVSISDMIKILSSHGENVAEKTVYKTAPAHPSCICVDRTVNASVFQLRSWMPVEVGSVIWTTGGRPCYELFVPWYIGMSKSPKGFTRFDTADEAIKKHFSDAKDMQLNYPDCAAWKFLSFWDWLIEDYNGRIGETKEAIGKMQQSLFKGQKEFESKMMELYNAETKQFTNKSKLEKQLNNYTAKWYDSYFKVLKKIQQGK